MSSVTPEDGTSVQAGGPGREQGGLGAPEQQAAEAMIGALPPDVKQDIAATVVQGLDTSAQKQQAAEAVIGALPPDVKQQVAETVLGSPDQRTRQILWYLVVSTLTIAVFVFGSMAFVLVYQKKAAEAPLALATAALGAIIGLVATSPGSRSLWRVCGR
ncbi:MAG: hypothetical protein JO132_19660 [Streptosporangiaceae bacterium]|nr:hypothetical protein [Streptosporangiaceae bacterium]